MENITTYMDELKENEKGGNNDYYKPPLNNEVIKSETEQAPKDLDNSKEGNDKDYGRSTELYNEKFLSKARRNHFITIPQSGQNHQDLYDNIIKASKNIKYLCIAKETHKNEGEHYHILITTQGQGIRIMAIHRRIMETKGDIGGSINYQQVKNAKAVVTYIKKDGNFLEFGEIKEAHDPASAGSSADIDKLLNELYNNELSQDENIQLISQQYPSYYTINYEAIVGRLQAKENVKQLRWVKPKYNSENTKLKPYQQRIWDLINEPPTNRRIIWVHGRPNSGKSFMFNYIAQNYKYGIYSAGSTASLDNAVYGYDGEGAICWDIPLNYNFAELGDHLASTIEKFSDFGQTLTSRKYKGKKIDVLGHVLVFSNRHCLAQLNHRDIIRINTRDDESEEEKLDTYNITKKTKNKKTVWIESQPTDDGQSTERTYYHSKADLPIHVLEDVYNS